MTKQPTHRNNLPSTRELKRIVSHYDTENAPEGATHRGLAGYYKIGRHGYVYRWVHGEWSRAALEHIDTLVRLETSAE